ncbi:MAG: hypothetical protein KKF77_14395 [Proteobacteria bacterium]|nr:hypothetical protein [Pseudomonadota bacterium]
MKSNAIRYIQQGNTAMATSKIALFFKQFNVVRLAGRYGISKTKGVSPGTLLMTLVSLPFFGQNIFRAVVSNPRCGIGKDAVYDFLASSHFSWRRFLLQLAIKAIAMLDSLTNKTVNPCLSSTTPPSSDPELRRSNSSPESMTTARIVSSKASA